MKMSRRADERCSRWALADGELMLADMNDKTFHTELAWCQYTELRG
jgi:hypothetical protein